MELAIAILGVLSVALGIYAKVYVSKQEKAPEKHIEETDADIQKTVASGDRVAVGLKLKQLFDKARRSGLGR